MECAAAGSRSPDAAIPADTLHRLACLLRHARGAAPRTADALATAAWAAASARGHRAATLSLARQLIGAGALGRAPALRPVEARFRRLVAAADADALAADGERLLALGRPHDAAATLRHALRVGGARFEWRALCELALGRALRALGDADAAARLLGPLADAGLADAEAELGQVLRGRDAELGQVLKGRDADAARQHLYAAACAGRRDMFAHLSEMALEGDGSAEGDGSVEERRRWAAEWSRLADARAEY